MKNHSYKNNNNNNNNRNNRSQPTCGRADNAGISLALASASRSLPADLLAAVEAAVSAGAVSSHRHAQVHPSADWAGKFACRSGLG
jgi:hypothetical protein